MDSNTEQTDVVFNASERAWLRQQLAPQFGISPIIAEGFLLKIWKSGQCKGEARLPPPVSKMVDRGLMLVGSTNRGKRAFLTPKGLIELRDLFLRARFMNINEFGDLHLQFAPIGDIDAEGIASAKR